MAALALVLLAGCQTHGMSFSRDTRIRIVEPVARALVRAPVRIAWSLERSLERSIEASEGERYFAVFIDRAPIRGGRDVSSFVDRECRTTPGCGDEEWFNDRGIYFTSGTSVLVDEFEDLRNDRDDDRDRHRATVVVMRRAEERVLETLYDGTRDGEGSVAVEFWLERGPR